MTTRVKKHRVLVLMHEQNVPPGDFEGLTAEQIDEVRTEDNVIEGLRGLGHEVVALGIGEELSPCAKPWNDSSRIWCSTS